MLDDLREGAQNPLLNLRFNIPFESLQPAHVEPAVQALLERGRRNIEAIEGESSPPTYANTLGGSTPPPKSWRSR